MSWILCAIQFGLSALFLVAATGKALRSEEFVAALRFSRLPERVVTPVGALVPILELGVAAALVIQTPRSFPIALGVAVVLLAAFTAWMAWIRVRGLRLRCGCFGTGSAEIGPRSIGRNLVLLGFACGGLVLARRTSSPLPGPSFELLVAVTSLGMCVALLLALRAALPALVLGLDRLPSPAPESQGGD